MNIENSDNTSSLIISILFLITKAMTLKIKNPEHIKNSNYKHKIQSIPKHCSLYAKKKKLLSL